jgi:hypothetical protein
MPVLPSLSKPTVAALVPAAPSAPGGDLRNHRQDDRRRMTPRRFLEGLRADQHADVEQDRQDCDHRDQA